MLAFFGGSEECFIDVGHSVPEFEAEKLVNLLRGVTDSNREA